MWNDGYEIRAFEDRWKGGVNNYVGWMAKRLSECHRVLKKNGLMYLHCDYYAGHYLKVECDKIFGYNNFRNEIIWCYSGGGIPKKDFPNKHDTIFRYSKTNDYKYYPEFKAYSEGTVERGRTAVKAKFFENGVPKLRKEGTPITDWWTDIKYIHSPTDYEKLGYPTQKSEELLTRIIKISSDADDIVLDPFCGCGTAIASAQKMTDKDGKPAPRRWIGIDVSPTACKLMAKRMKKITGTNPNMIGMPKSLADLKKLQPFEFQNWVMDKLYARVSPRKVGDMGIDGFYIDGSPIQVKQSGDVSRPVVDAMEAVLGRIDKKKGVIVAYSFSKGAYEEVARAKREQGLEITLKTVNEILSET
ncbi:MAG: DNA methyltransferase [Nitrosopumilaceae archaeon]